MRTIQALAVCGLCLALGGCDSSPADPAGPVVSQPAFGIEPQPFRVLPFAAVGTVDGRWTGRLGDGDLVVETRLAQRLGATMGLVQSWTFMEPTDGESTATLFGIIDLRTGALVLNGATADGGILHVQGDGIVSEGGAISVGGDVMFNPQPEPPGHF